jgi:hypothetical protein
MYIIDEDEDDIDDSRYSIDISRGSSLAAADNNNNNNNNSSHYTLNQSNSAYSIPLYTPKDLITGVPLTSSRDVTTDASTTSQSSLMLSATERRRILEDDTERDAYGDNEILPHQHHEISEYESSDEDSIQSSSDTEENDNDYSSDDDDDEKEAKVDVSIHKNVTTTDSIVTFSNSSRGNIVQMTKLNFSSFTSQQPAVTKQQQQQQQQQQPQIQLKQQKTKSFPIQYSQPNKPKQLEPATLILEERPIKRENSITPRSFPPSAHSDNTSSFSVTPKKKGLYSSYKSMTLSDSKSSWIQKAYTPRVNITTSNNNSPVIASATSVPISDPPISNTTITLVNFDQPIQSQQQQQQQQDKLPISPRIVFPNKDALNRNNRGFSLPAKIIPLDQYHQGLQENIIQQEQKMTQSDKETESTDGIVDGTYGNERTWSMQSLDATTTTTTTSLEHLSKTLTDLVKETSRGEPNADKNLSLSNRSENSDVTSHTSSELSSITTSSTSLSKDIMENVEIAAHYLQAASKQITQDRLTLSSERKKTEQLQTSVSYYQQENEKYERLKQLYARQCVEKESVERKVLQMKQQLQGTLEVQKRLEMQNREMQIEMNRLGIEFNECKDELARQRRRKCSIM